MKSRIVRLPRIRSRRGFGCKIADKIDVLVMMGSKAGALQTAHYHKRCGHFLFLLEGKLRYSERPLRAVTTAFASTLVKADYLIETPPGVVHTIEFLADCTYLAFSDDSGGIGKGPDTFYATDDPKVWRPADF